MSLKIVNFSDGFSSASVPSVVSFSPLGVQRVIVSALNITNGYTALNQAPASPTATIMSWNGIDQIYGTDFDVTGLQLNFLSGLSGLINTNDNLTILYQ